MARGAAFRIPDDWVARGWRFEVEPTTQKQRSAIAQHFGARRFAYNWALAQVKANLDARTADPTIPPLAWNLRASAGRGTRPSTRSRRGGGTARRRPTPAGSPTWSRLCTTGPGQAGRRGAGRIGFPRFKARRHDHGRVRFTTGAMRLEPDRRHLVLPVIGRLRSKENTRRLERLVAKGRARVLSMTLSEQRPGGRLFVSVATIVAQAPGIPGQPAARCGIDLGIGQEWAVIAHHDDTIERIAHPRPVVVRAAAAPPGRPAAIPPHRRLPRVPPGERQAGGPGPAGGQPPPRIHPHPYHPAWPAATALSWSKTSTSPRWAAGWAGERSGAASTRPGSAGSGRRWPTRRAGGEGGWWWPTAGSRPPRPITAAAATCADLASAERVWACPRCEELVDRNANAARNLRDWTGPVTTGMSSGVELPPRCRSWVTTAGRLTHPRGRARPQKTTGRWRGPMTPEPTPRSRGEEPRAGAPGKE